MDDSGLCNALKFDVVVKPNTKVGHFKGPIFSVTGGLVVWLVGLAFVLVIDH